MPVYWLFFLVLLMVPAMGLGGDKSPYQSPPAIIPESPADFLEGLLIEVHPRQALSIERPVIGRIIDTTGSPWPYRIHQKHGLDWYRKPVAFIYSGYFKTLKEGLHTVGLFIEHAKIRRNRHRIEVSCQVSVCLNGELRIESRRQSYQSRHPPKKKDQMQLAYFVSELLGPGYHRLSMAIACHARRPEVLDALRLSLKLKSPSSTVLSDATPTLFVHKRKPEPSDAQLACSMTER